MIDPDETFTGMRVRRITDGRRGRIAGPDIDRVFACVIWRGDEDYDHEYEPYSQLDAVPDHPAIGAVVAMVAAARMVLGGWQPYARTSKAGVSHWDFVSSEWAQTSHAACGNVWPGDYGSSSDIDDVDCPACRDIHFRAAPIRDRI